MANNKSIFLDANVLLEIVLERKNSQLAREIIIANAGHLNISALTAHLVVYFGQNVVGLPVIRKFLGDYNIQTLSSADFEWAFNNARNADFEDALQLAVAIRTGSEEFITLDKTLFETYQNLSIIDVKLLQ